MRCPACGSEAPDTAKFCETCGSPLRAQEDVAQTAAMSTGAGFDTANAQPSAGGGYAPVPGSDPAVDAAPYDATAAGGASGPTGQTASFAQGQPQGHFQGQAYSQPGPQAGPYGNPSPSHAPTPPASAQPAGKQASIAPFVLSIIALVTAVLGLFPVSIILAIIALVMNSGQKKRGETSTKQTPTFVMGLISLILSILMAAITALIGGVVWLYLADNDFDLDEATKSAPAESSQAQPQTEAQSAVGTWKVVSLESGDDALGEEYLDLMESLGMKVEIVLTEDGAASFEMLGESETGTWEDRGSGVVAITLDGETIEAKIVDDEMSLSIDDEKVVLRRISKEASVGASSAAPSSTSAQGIAELLSELEGEVEGIAGSSDSGTSASAKDGAVKVQSFDTDERPTLEDFVWFTADMVEGRLPQDAVKLTSLSEVKGDWKAYSFGSGMEHFFNVEIDGEGSNATVEFDWYYTHDGTTDEGFADDTPDSTFTGVWNAGLDATGPGRVTLTDFWQQNNHQYATGSFVWPSGEVDTMLMVRP